MVTVVSSCSESEYAASWGRASGHIHIYRERKRDKKCVHCLKCSFLKNLNCSNDRSQYGKPPVPNSLVKLLSKYMICFRKHTGKRSFNRAAITVYAWCSHGS